MFELVTHKVGRIPTKGGLEMDDTGADPNSFGEHGHLCFPVVPVTKNPFLGKRARAEEPQRSSKYSF